MRLDREEYKKVFDKLILNEHLQAGIADNDIKNDHLK